MRARWVITAGVGVALAGGVILLARRAGAAEITFGDALISAATEDLRRGVHEDLGANDGERIREYFAGSGITPPANWCAAAVTTWIREAARAAGVAPPIPGSMSAKTLMDQVGGAGVWVKADAVRGDPSLVLPGQVVVWDRSRPDDPSTSWWGHVGVVISRVDGGKFRTIEGNSGPDGTRVAEVTRRIDDPRLLGVGAAWSPSARRGVTTLRSRRARMFVPPEEGGG